MLDILRIYLATQFIFPFLNPTLGHVGSLFIVRLGPVCLQVWRFFTVEKANKKHNKEGNITAIVSVILRKIRTPQCHVVRLSSSSSVQIACWCFLKQVRKEQHPSDFQMLRSYKFRSNSTISSNFVAPSPNGFKVGGGSDAIAYIKCCISPLITSGRTIRFSGSITCKSRKTSFLCFLMSLGTWLMLFLYREGKMAGRQTVDLR